MAAVTYYVALPFVASDEGVAPGEIECVNPSAAVGRAEAFSRKAGKCLGAIRICAPVTPLRAISAMLRGSERSVPFPMI